MRTRLLVSYLTITSLALVLLVVPLGLTFAGREKEHLVADLERDATVIAGLVEDGLDQSEPVDYVAIADAYEARTGARVVIVDEHGISLADTEGQDVDTRDFSTRPEIASALDGDRSVGVRESETLGAGIIYVAVPVSSGGVVHGAVRLSYPTSELDSRIRANWIRLGLLSLLVLSVVAVVGVVLARGVTRPLSQLKVATAALASGDLARRVPVDRGPPEVRSLGASFNEMARRLGELVDAQRDFVADASHQLRTPLTALRLRLENAEAGEDDPLVQADLTAAIDETARLSRLVDGLILLAAADSRPPTLVVTDLVAVAVDRVQTWAPLAEEQQVTLDLAAPAVAGVRSVPGSVEQMLDNLIDNALEVSPEGSTIEIAIDVGPSSTVLHVIDAGPGLDEDARERAFDRFWRSPDAPPGGSGLGLAIVKQLASQCHAVAGITVAPGGGLDVSVAFPADRGEGLPGPADPGKPAVTPAS